MKLVVAGALALALAGGCGKNGAPDEDAYRTAPAAVTASLGGLKAGDELGPVRVKLIAAMESGRIPVIVSMGTSEGRIEIALAATEGPLPVATTEKYHLFWGTVKPGSGIDAESLKKACEALAERLRTAEKTRPPAPGLKPYGQISTSM